MQRLRVHLKVELPMYHEGLSKFNLSLSQILFILFFCLKQELFRIYVDVYLWH